MALNLSAFQPKNELKSLGAKPLDFSAFKVSASEPLPTPTEKPRSLDFSAFQNKPTSITLPTQPRIVRTMDIRDVGNIPFELAKNLSGLVSLAEVVVNKPLQINPTFPHNVGGQPLEEPLTGARAFYENQVKSGIPDDQAFINASLRTVVDMAILAPMVKNFGKLYLLKTAPEKLVDVNMVRATRQQIRDFSQGITTENPIPEPIQVAFRNASGSEKATMLKGTGVDVLNAEPSLLAKMFGVSQDEINGLLETQFGGAVRQSPVGELPGYRTQPGQAPAFGLSTQRVEPVGFGNEPTKPSVVPKTAPTEAIAPKVGGGIQGRRGLAKVGLATETPKKIVKTETQLLKDRVRNEARGTKIGFKIGQQEARLSITNQLRNTFETKIGEIKRGGELGNLKTNIKTRDFDRVRGEIVNYIKENISVSDRGTFLNMVKDAKTQTDLAKAFTRVDTNAQDIKVKDAVNTLKKTVDKMIDSPSVSADYVVKIKDIIDSYELSGHTQATIDKLQATQDFIYRQASIGEDVALPQRMIDKLKILGRTPKSELTLSQIEGLQNEVELLAQLGKTKWATKQALYDAEKEARKQQLLDSVSPINSKQVRGIGLEESPKNYVTTYIKARNYLQKTRVGLTPIDGLADITGMRPMKEVMDLNFGNYLTYNDENIRGWYELTKDFDESNFKRIGAYAVAQQEGGIERLANANITQEQVDALNLTPEEKKAYNYVRETFDKEFPAVKKYALDVYNKDVGDVKNYVSFMSDNDALNELEMYDRFGTPSDNTNLKKTTEQGFTEQRAKTADYVPELNIDKIFRRHTDDVAYMLTTGRDIKQYFEIVNSPEIRAKLGDVGSLAWLQYLDLMARKGGSEGAKRIAILDTIRQNLALGVLSFRVSSAMIQFTSFADTMATIGSEWAMRGASSVATSKEWRNFIMDNFPEVKKAVGDDIAFREFGDDYLDQLGQKGLRPLQYLDGLMRSTAVSGAYQMLLARDGKVLDFANPDTKLIQEATKLMRFSQGSSFFKDQPLSLTSNFGLTDNKSLNKTILTFQSFMLARWDNMQRQIWRLGIKEKDYQKAFTSFFWMVVVAATMEEGIRRGVKWTENEVASLITGKEGTSRSGTFAGNSVMNVVQAVPVMGQLVSSMSYSSNPVPTINTFEQILSGASSVWNGEALNTKIRGGITLLGATGSVAGVPGSSQVSQYTKSLVPPANAKSKNNSGLPMLPALPSLPALPRLPKLPKI